MDARADDIPQFDSGRYDNYATFVWVCQACWAGYFFVSILLLD
jgi:hypothetical protein